MYDFNPSKPIHEEALILKALAIDTNDKWHVRGLRELAWRGSRLRKRYEDSCNYSWATTDEFLDTTAMTERFTYELAQSLGLHIYLQTDPRGATIYASRDPIPENSYNASAQCIYYLDEGIAS